VAALQAQLDAAQRTGAEAGSLRSQLVAAQAAAADAQVAAVRAAQDAQAAAARISQFEGRLGGVDEEAASLRAQLATAQRAAEDARLQVTRAAGEVQGERAAASRSLQEVTDLQAQLLREREGHDATKHQLRELQSRLDQQATPPRSGRGPAAAAGPPPPSPLSPDSVYSPPPVAVQGDLAAAIVSLPHDIAELTMAELKGWVTEHRLEDEEYMALSSKAKTKKGEWVAYVRKRAGV